MAEKKSGDKTHELLKSNLVLNEKLTHLINSNKELNENVAELVKIFRTAGDYIKTGKYEDPLVNKINELVEQNKNLQHALRLLEDYVKPKAKPEY